jgi:hypothetical protein
MNNDYRYVGCVGGSCPKQEHCARFVERDERPQQYRSAPFNRYEGGVTQCNYYEPAKEEE